jgi:hypothetical protein
MAGWADRLAHIGDVHRFDYPYMLEGRRSPDRQDKLIAAHRRALAERRRPDLPTVLVGKSMGGRIGCHVALEDPVDALVCLGYPLKGMGRAGKLRDAVLTQLATPVLFVQGTRDRLCPIELLMDVRDRMTAPNELFLVEGGNHSLEVTKSALGATGETQDEVNDRILNAIAAFVGVHVQTGPPHR